MPSSRPTRGRSAGRRRTSLALAAILMSPLAVAETEKGSDDKEPLEDKRGYSLVVPTPRRSLREFDPDRPGQSHDPTTIDAGHVQIETGAYEQVYDPRGAATGTTRRYILGNPLARIGLTNASEIQIGAPLYQLLRTGGVDQTQTRSFGDTSLGTKVNLLGNDSGDHLLGVLATVKFGTARIPAGNGYTEYTLAVPYNYNITPELTLTLEPSVAALRNADNTRYRDSYGMIAGFDYLIAKKVIASLEVFTVTTTARKEATNWGVSPSVAFLATNNLQFDAGIVLGLNKATPRYDPYVGVSMRF